MSEPETYEAFAALVRRMESQSKLLRTWQLHGGVSAQITGIEIVRADGSRKKWVVRQHGERDRRRNPNVAADEFRLLQLLRDQEIAAPTPYFLQETSTLLPTPCIVLEYIEGETDFSPAHLDNYLYQLSAQLARIHSIRDNLSFLPRQTRGFGPRPANLDNSLAEGWIRDTLESLCPVRQHNESVLLHGDFWPGNVLWREDQLVAVIDWEDAAFGDPLADVGNSRLEILWAFGNDAMECFTRHYASMTTVDFFNLPYWDLCAALRPASKISGWGLDAETERDLREKHRLFIAQASDRLTLLRD